MNRKYVTYFMAFFCFYFSMGVLVSILSVYLADEGLKSTQISVVTSATAIFTVLTQTSIGMLADRIRRTKLVAMGVMLIAGICGSLICQTGTVFLLFLLNGIAQSFIIGTVPLLDTLTIHSGYTYGAVRIGGSVGYAVAAQVAGILYDRFPPEAAFVVYGLAALLTVFFISGMKEVKYDSKPKEAESGRNVIGKLLHNRAYVVFLIVYFIVLGLHYANIAYMPLLIREMGGVSTNTGTVLLLQTLFEIPVFLGAEKIIKKVSFRSLLVFVSAVMAIRMFWYASYPDIKWMTAVFFFQGLTTGVFYALTVKLVARIIAKEYVNTALALGSMIGKGIGALFFQLMGGVIGELYGFGKLYLILGIFGCISVIASLFYKETEAAL